MWRIIRLRGEEQDSDFTEADRNKAAGLLQLLAPLRDRLFKMDW